MTIPKEPKIYPADESRGRLFDCVDKDDYDALREYAEGLERFYNEVMSCADDTWQCEVCGHAEPWWKDTNADYLTREVVATMKKGAERE